MMQEIFQFFIGYPFRRSLSKLSPQSDLKQFTVFPDFLYPNTVGFKLFGNQIKLLHQPNEFYQTLIEKSSAVKERLILCSLYIGTGSLEDKLVSVINKRLQEVPNLNVSVLLDCLRGSRGDSNSISLLSSSLKNHPNNFKLHLYHTPKLRGILQYLLPNRYNEIVGLQHMKFYIFDNDVVISGANLSNDYFTARQDRYFLILGCKPFADFLSGLHRCVSDFSYEVSSSVELKTPKLEDPAKHRLEDFIKAAKDQIENFYSRQNSTKDEEGDTYIFPLLEMGPLGIHHDSKVTKRLLDTSTDNFNIYLATGYFNLTQQYSQSIIVNSKAIFKILTAHPEANGFLGAKGPAGGIPLAYRELANIFWKNVKLFKEENRIHLFEYRRKNWTFHAKGLWISQKNSDLPFLTMIGSPNFGERSVHHDLECQFLITTTNKNLQEDLKIERDGIFGFSEPFREISPPALWIQLVIRFFKTYL